MHGRGGRAAYRGEAVVYRGRRPFIGEKWRLIGGGGAIDGVKRQMQSRCRGEEPDSRQILMRRIGGGGVG